MNLLVFTTLYPNPGQPHHGVFVENRLRHLLAASGYTATVVAPVPWVPPGLRGHPKYRALRRVPAHEVRYGLDVFHPRYPVIPKVGMTAAPVLLYAAARRQVRALVRAGARFDAIDAHYFYPDGVAAALLARELGVPFTVTGRGTDLNLIPRYALPRRMIRWTAGRAAGLITVCDALRQDLGELGVDPARVRVLRNGVDLETFRRDPAGRDRWRAELGLGAAPVIVSVGHLIARKGHDLAIRALAELGPGTRLMIAGTGPEEPALRALAGASGVGGAGALPGRGGPRGSARGLFGGGRAGPCLQPGGLAQRAAGKPRLRHAGGRHGRQRHAGGGAGSGRRPGGGGAHAGRARRGLAGRPGQGARARWRTRLCRAVFLGRHQPGAGRAVRADPAGRQPCG